ncbi:hypothetical protein GSI_04147 [Ganoderma sinense ZZ0214-1]|uniref:Uncharacterized protein n=1 Tax=Ganoderma sinense ZZ0214-1 TaxID=1077348 RepID=A0A2G8SIC8_9APHY|nr:hypothetical protein GSI_04147 [Ganoderma sinense ZZ0214-1]
MFKSLSAASAPVQVPPTNPDDATKQALLAVVQVWLDRLQAMAVITSFFVSIDSMVYAFPSRNPDLTAWSSLDLLISASLGGAIILHVCASILAYISSFVLIRYQLSDAQKTEQSTERPSGSALGAGKAHARVQSLSIESALSEAYVDLRALVSVYKVRYISVLTCGMVPRQSASEKRDAERPASGSDDPVAKLKGMVTTLSRCHTLVTVMTQLGFVLALLGIIAYFWTELPQALAIFASVLLGACLLAIGVVIM